jgi:hypothetical protein
MDYTCTTWDSLSEKVYAGRTEKFIEKELKDKIKSPLEHGRRDCDLCVVRMVAILWLL